jgi:NADPH-dependent glutamate synthase beta subunit-like oxidoreductase
MISIAIVGSGPAGCYLADQLLRLIPDASIDALEKLPVPFGLIRYGVAPDHQSTKGIARVFDRVLSRDHVSFFGNVEVGRDVRLDELMTLYDAVVLATGAARDRRLGIPGEDLPGVIGSGSFVSWYNGHPRAQAPTANDVQSGVIIGNGNVALDVARILAKGPEELAGSDVAGEFVAWLRAQPLETVHVVGRRGAAEARFADHELAELGTLQRARTVVSDPASLAGDTAVVKTLRGFAASGLRDTPVTINFHFNLAPTAFLGDDKLQEVQFRSMRGEAVILPAQMAVTCIGYEALPCCSAVPEDGVFANQEGAVDERLYVVGWAKRGPSGTIPTNRVEAQQLAQRIAQETHSGERPGGAGLRKLLEERKVRWVDYQGWRRIDAAELARASAGRSREKFTDTDEMLEAALDPQLRPA